jgi:hypothetical protein
MKVFVYTIYFTSGHKVRTFEFDTEIIETANRLKDTYANYYKISHDIKDIIFEDCIGSELLSYNRSESAFSAPCKAPSIQPE